MIGKRFNNLNLRSKLLLLHFLISIPIILISAFFLWQSTQSSYNNMRDISVIAVNQLSDSIAGQFEELYNISERVLAEGSVRKYIGTHFKKPYDSYKAYTDSVKPILDVMTIFRTDIRIEIYSDNPMAMFSADTSQDLEALARRTWYNPDRFTITPTWLVENEDAYHVRPNTIGFYRMMRLSSKDSRTEPYIMALAVAIREESLYALISGSVSEGREVFLYRDDGTVVCTTDRSAVFGQIKDYGLTDFRGENAPEEQKLTMNGKSYLAIRKPFSVGNIGISNWNILYLIPLEQLTNNNATIMYLGIALCVACMALSLILTHTVTDNIIRRIRLLSETIKNAWNKKFDVRAEITGNDEIGTLENNFNVMVQRIDSLKEEVFQTSLKYLDSEIKHNQMLLEKREAEIAALSAQINPHYLFNTLEAIKMSMLVKHNIDEAVSTLDAFAGNFRFIIDTSNSFVTLMEELQFLRKYTVIQKYSYGENLKYIFSVSEQLLDCLLPKLLLQPLVENALYHGVIPKDGGTISISIQPCEGGRIEIKVEDDGVGMGEAILSEVKEALSGARQINRDGKTHIALYNISRRLHLMYEDSAEMRVESAPGAGTCITVYLPVKKSDKGMIS